MVDCKSTAVVTCIGCRKAKHKWMVCCGRNLPTSNRRTNHSLPEELPLLTFDQIRDLSHFRMVPTAADYAGGQYLGMRKKAKTVVQNDVQPVYISSSSCSSSSWKFLQYKSEEHSRCNDARLISSNQPKIVPQLVYAVRYSCMWVFWQLNVRCYQMEVSWSEPSNV